MIFAKDRGDSLARCASTSALLIAQSLLVRRLDVRPPTAAPTSSHEARTDSSEHSRMSGTCGPRLSTSTPAG